MRFTMPVHAGKRNSSGGGVSNRFDPAPVVSTLLSRFLACGLALGLIGATAGQVEAQGCYGSQAGGYGYGVVPPYMAWRDPWSAQGVYPPAQRFAQPQYRASELALQFRRGYASPFVSEYAFRQDGPGWAPPWYGSTYGPATYRYPGLGP